MKYVSRIWSLAFLAMGLWNTNAFAVCSDNGQACDGQGSPTSVYILFYRLVASTSQTCSSPFVVIDNSANPQWVDMASNPQLGAGTLNPGTYPCIGIQMSSEIKYSIPSAVGTYCAAGQHTMTVCQNGNSTKDYLGNVTNCTGSNSDVVTLWLSTGSSNSGGGGNNNPFTPPTSVGDSSHGFNLANALVATGSTSSTFKVDFTNDIYSLTGGGGSCNCEAPTFTFK